MNLFDKVHKIPKYKTNYIFFFNQMTFISINLHPCENIFPLNASGNVCKNACLTRLKRVNCKKYVYLDALFRINARNAF